MSGDERIEAAVKHVALAVFRTASGERTEGELADLVAKADAAAAEVRAILEAPLRPRPVTEAPEGVGVLARVRIAVFMHPDGRWIAVGNSDWDDQRAASAAMAEVHVYGRDSWALRWVEAGVPIPEPLSIIKGEAK